MKTGLCTFFLLYAVTLFAQQSYSPKYTFLRFENDVCEGTDEYYTSGGVLGFYTPGLGKNPLNKLMMSIPDTDNHIYGLELTQDIYTPRNTDTLNYLPDDRPFAGILMARMKRVSFLPEKYIRLKTSLGLGLVGAAAFAGQTQNGVHSMINSTIYRGWFNQLGKPAADQLRYGTGEIFIY